MKKFQIILMAVLMAAGMGQSALVIFTNSFSSDTVGSLPVATSVRPFLASQAVTNSLTVVSGSAIGSGNAVRFVDNSTNATVGFEYNFVASSNHQENAIGVSFQYNQRSTAGSSQLNISLQQLEAFGRHPVAGKRTCPHRVQWRHSRREHL
jgi:hypothetical protein